MPRKNDKKCLWCTGTADRLCDGQLVDGTCDAPVCSACSTHLNAEQPMRGIVCVRGGKGKGCYPFDNRGDLCPFCTAYEGDPLERREQGPRMQLNAARSRARKFRLGPQPGDRIYLVDTDGVVHRNFHALPLEHALTDPTIPINAVIGTLRTMRKLRSRIEPTPVWVLPIFDGAPGGGWRRREFKGYKSERPPQPPELESQWGRVRDLITALGLRFVRSPGVEADDVIAAYVADALELGLEVVIVSDDKDLSQLLRGTEGPGSVRQMSAFGELELRDESHVVEKFGVPPSQLADLLALMGDRSDQIPGVPGVGSATGAKLLKREGSLEAVLERWEFNKGKKLREALRDSAEQVRLNRRLVDLRPVEITLQLHDLARWVPSRRALDDYFGRFGFPRFEAAVDRVQHE